LNVALPGTGGSAGIRRLHHILPDMTERAKGKSRFLASLGMTNNGGGKVQAEPFRADQAEQSLHFEMTVCATPHARAMARYSTLRGRRGYIKRHESSLSG
jgi:hypothetical protein